MKELTICILIFATSIIGCKTNEEKNIQSLEQQEESIEHIPAEESKRMLGEGNHQYDPTQTLYFSHAFIYEYTLDGETEEFWIYHNPENGQLLYTPEDPMVEFVVSDTLGNYYFFGSDGHGIKTVDAEFVDWVANPELYDSSVSYPISDRYVSIKPTGKKKSLDEYSSVNGKPIIGEEYQWTFHQVSGKQVTYITEAIPVNFYQVYGFNKLEGDIRLPVIDLDFTGIFGKNQTVTYLESENLKVELSFYQFNPAFVEAGDYQYAFRTSDGTWKKETLPLLISK